MTPSRPRLFTSDECSQFPMTAASELRSGKTHRDENFPVASWIIHPRHRALILAFYAYWARSTQLHQKMPPQSVSALVWGAVFFLSVLALAAAAA